MKNLFASFALLLFTFSISAQITSGHASYQINISSDDPDMAGAVSMMKNTKMDLYFVPQKTKTVLDLDMMTNTIITDNSNDKAMILMELMGMKIAIQSTVSKLKEKGEAEIENKPTIKFTNESKDILGYKCKKATVTDKDGFKAIFWYTEEIKGVNTEGQELFNKEIPGFLMEFETISEGLKMNFIIHNFSEGSADFTSNTFSTETPEGYKEMTEQDLEQMGM